MPSLVDPSTIRDSVVVSTSIRIPEGIIVREVLQVGRGLSFLEVTID